MVVFMIILFKPMAKLNSAPFSGIWGTANSKVPKFRVVSLGISK